MSLSKELLDKVALGTLSSDEALRLINEEKAKEKKDVHYKVSTKGAIAFYGLRRMPITLYIEELERILKVVMEEPKMYSKDFEAFITENEGKLTRK